MPLTVPSRLAPSIAWGLTSFRPSVRLLGRTGLPAAGEFEAFLLALGSVPSDAPTACDAWSAHELVAHLAAGSEEMARLVEARLERGPDADIGSTRSQEEREPPYRAMTDAALRRRFVLEGMRLTDAILKLSASGPEVTVTFTGWDMTAAQMVLHGRSELALHRWDLVGSDSVSLGLLDPPEILAHGETVLARMGQRGTGVSGPCLRQCHEPARGADALLRLWGRDPDRSFPC